MRGDADERRRSRQEEPSSNRSSSYSSSCRGLIAYIDGERLRIKQPACATVCCLHRLCLGWLGGKRWFHRPADSLTD